MIIKGSAAVIYIKKWGESGSNRRRRNYEFRALTN
jgi:hypothetical protein